MNPTVTQQLSGWGRYPAPLPCQTLRPERPDAHAQEIVEHDHQEYISRGLGRGYGDSAVNQRGAVILHTQLNRVIDFDPDTGALHCEAGVSIADIIDAFLPRGYFPPVTPGTKFVTVGGAIAADVHGKNHHLDGAFSNFVDRFQLLTADGQTLDCSPSQNAEAFWGTVGGMGLTGAILSARIRLLPVETAYLNVAYQKAKNLGEAIDLFEQNGDDYPYSVAWIDGLASGKSLGRSVLIQGSHATRDQLTGPARANPLTPTIRSQRTIPFHFPSCALNKFSVKGFNALYYARHKNRQTLEDYDTFFYPLDRIGNWNRIYGRRGFTQYQALLPPETARRGTAQLLETVSRSGAASFLSVFKKTGPATRGLLSFPFPGYTLALDLPNTGAPLLDLLERLDAITLKHNGRLYLAKDATMNPQTFGAMYPRLNEFLTIKAKLDPHNRFVSEQARRLGLANPPTLDTPPTPKNPGDSHA